MNILRSQPIEISIISDGDIFYINFKTNDTEISLKSSFSITIAKDDAKTMARALIDDNRSVETTIKTIHFVS